MLRYLRKVQFSLFVISLACSVSMAHANGDFDTNEKCTVLKTKKCYSTIVKKPKKNCVKKNRHHLVKKSYESKEYESKEIENEIESDDKVKKNTCKNTSYAIEEYCEPFLPERLYCKTINPSDLVDFTCDDFSEKIQSCSPYSCQAPYVLDPSIKTVWQIHGKSGSRCLISNTTEDIGIKDDNEMPVPLTQMCEYDDMGIKGLLRRFSDVEKRYFHFSTCEHFEGIYNCTFRTGGVPVK